VDGTSQTRLTDDSASDGAPNWSPDGLKIVFESNRGGGAYDIFVMSWDGSGVTNLTTTDSDEGVPAWSPDGTRIAFMSDRAGGPQLFVASADGASPVRITSDPGLATHPDWQPSTTTTTSSETTITTETETTGTAEGQGDPVAGKEVFLGGSGCSGCHTLADAGTSGSVGPNLNETLPSYDLVIERVTNGQGGMPPFMDTLTEQQIQDVAAYVSSVAGGS